MENIVMKCECCNRVKELRLGICFDCATSESIIVEGVDMYDREVEKSDGLSDGLSKVKHILKLYGITKD